LGFPPCPIFNDIMKDKLLDALKEADKVARSLNEAGERNTPIIQALRRMIKQRGKRSRFEVEPTTAKTGKVKAKE